MTTPWTSLRPVATALTLMVLLAAGSATAQTLTWARESEGRLGVPIATIPADSWAPRPLTSGALARAEALGAAPGVDAARAQTASTAPTRSAGSCVKKLVIAGAIGTAAGAGVAAARLAATGGSDATGAIVRKYAGIGLVFGVVGGALACLSS